MNWGTNSSLSEIAALLREAKHVVLLTHARPDGDAIGATLAVARCLGRLDIKATPVYAGPWSHRFDGIVGATETVRVGMLTQAPKSCANADLILVMDTGSWSQLAEVRAWIEPLHEKIALIDHHLHGDASVASLRVVDSASAATCQTVAPLCLDLLGLSSVTDFPVDVAEPLYLGVATDTGWFRHSNVSPDVLHLAARLLDAGVDHKSVYERVEQSDNPARIRLIGRAINSMQLLANERVAVLTLTQQDLKECHGSLDDMGGMNDLPMNIGSVRVSAVISEIADNVCKVSLRSKPKVDADDVFVNVNEVAMSLGGGGHAQASGCKLREPVGDASTRIADALVACFE